MRTLKKDFLFLFLLAMVGGGIYAGTFSNQFVYDDQVTVRENLFIRDWKNLSRFFSSDYYLRSEEYSFRPMVTLSYFLDYSWSGTDPRGYHLTNLILHLLSVGAVYFLARKVLRSRGAAFLGSLAFTVHPALVEAVAGISFREDLLCAFFFFLSLLLYISSERREMEPREETPARAAPALFPISILFFLLALLSKEMAVTLPLVAAAYEIIIRQRRGRDLLRPRLVILFVIGGLYVAARFLLLYQRGAIPAAPDFGDVFTRLLLVFKGVGLYGRLIFFPLKLTVEYPDPLPPLVWGDYLLLPALLTGAGLIWAGLKFPGGPAKRFGLAFLLLTLLPILNIVPNARLGAERFLYLPFAGFALFGAAALSSLWNGISSGRLRRLFGGVVSLILLFWALGTIGQNRVWKDNLTLFTRAVRASPRSSKAHQGLGNELFRLGRLPEAAAELKESIAIFPREPLYHNSLGVVYGELGMLEAALEQFRESSRLNPGDPLVLMNLSTLSLRAGKIPEALRYIENYIRARPFDPKGYLNRGEIYLSKREYRTALASYREALSRNPSLEDGLSGMGYCYYRLNDYPRARDAWEKALRLDPANPGIRSNLKRLSRKGF